MEKVRIICLEKEKRDVVAALHKFGMVELRKSSLELNDDNPGDYSSHISELMIKIDGAMQSLAPRQIKPEKQIKNEELVKAAEEKAKVADRVYTLVDERKQILEDQGLLDYANKVAQIFQVTEMNFSKLKSDILEYKAFVSGKKAIALFDSVLKKLKVEHESFVKNIGKDENMIFIAFDKTKNIDEATKATKLTELDLTARYLKGIPIQVLKEVGEKSATNKKRLNSIVKELDEISHHSYSDLANIKEMLQIELSRADASTMFKKTEKTTIIEGWVPDKNEHQLKSVLEHITSGRFDMEKIKSDELAPTYLNRPKLLKPFDFLMNFYSTPRSDEIDPTWIFIISFPIFYGLMLSDVGYGILSLLFVTWVARRTNPEGLVHNTAKVWQLTSVSAIFFGILSNQYLGIGLNQYIIPGFHGFDWFTDITSLIIITIIFGIVQVGLGFVLGAINNFNHGHKRHAISKIFSLLTVIFGTIGVAGLVFNAFAAPIGLYATILAIICIVVVVAANPSEATEITSLITHPLSYLRIMGFGLASVIIAFVIDKAFTPHLSTGIAGILLFVVYLVIFSVLHFLNMILGIFEGAVQSARLNFVEFFTKFYTGGGIKFNPFSYKRIHTKE